MEWETYRKANRYAQEDVAYLIPLYRKQRELMARDENRLNSHRL